MLITYRTKLIRAYYASINNWSLLAKKTSQECVQALKKYLGYESVKQLTDRALIEVLAKIQQRIACYV